VADPISDASHTSFYSPLDTRILGWLKEAVAEGDRINRSDAAYPKMDAAMDYVMGNQIKGDRPSYLPSVIINQTKRAIRTHVSALTDIRPLFNYKTFNEKFQDEATVLNRLVLVWWVNTFADVRLAEGIEYALTCGTGDVVVEYDPNFNQYGPTTSGEGGDTKLTARDPRDTLPIRPSRDLSIQGWEGVILREAVSPNVLASIYPEYRAAFRHESVWSTLYTKFRRLVSPVVGTPSTLDGLPGKPGSPLPSAEVHLYRTYLNDRSVNLNTGRVLMGRPGTNWCYWVEPGKPLYPRKRLIVATEKIILYDGPNPYWHGLYPVGRLKLESWPWQFLGTSLVHDLMPLQDALNTITNDFLQVFQQWVNRSIRADAQAVPEGEFKRFDPRKPLNKVRYKSGMGPGIEMLDGPQLPPWAMDFWVAMFKKHEELSEVANLQQLMTLRQMPGAETIQKYYEALTPGLRLEARMIEIFLRDVAEMVKCNIFQYKSTAQRMLILGDAGKTLSDFDYDPGTLVPSMDADDPRYLADLDRTKTRDDRAQYFHKLFTFYVSPNSILGMHAQDKKLEAIQLSRQGYMDFWTLMETLDIPNVGVPPPIPLPIRDWNPDTAPKDPATGLPLPPPMEIRIPVTITERLMAQQELGIGQQVSSVGRKATASAPPRVGNAGGGRKVIRESR